MVSGYRFTPADAAWGPRFLRGHSESTAKIIFITKSIVEVTRRTSDGLGDRDQPCELRYLYNGFGDNEMATWST